MVNYTCRMIFIFEIVKSTIVFYYVTTYLLPKWINEPNTYIKKN